MALARRVGYEYPAWSVRAALGLADRMALPVSPSVPQDIVCRHLGREVLHMLFVARGAKSEALRNWPSLRRSAREVLRLGRNDRWYNWRPDEKAVFFWDFWHTLHDGLIHRRR